MTGHQCICCPADGAQIASPEIVAEEADRTRRVRGHVEFVEVGVVWGAGGVRQDDFSSRVELHKPAVGGLPASGASQENREVARYELLRVLGIFTQTQGELSIPTNLP